MGVITSLTMIFGLLNHLEDNDNSFDIFTILFHQLNHCYLKIIPLHFEIILEDSNHYRRHRQDLKITNFYDFSFALNQ